LAQDLWPHFIHLSTNGSSFSSKMYGVFTLEHTMHLSTCVCKFSPFFTRLLETRFFDGKGCHSFWIWIVDIVYVWLKMIWTCMPHCGVPFSRSWHTAICHQALYVNKRSTGIMPDESCRNCGSLQMPCALCAKCRKEIQKICIRCGHRTTEQFHSNCFYDLECLQVVMPLIWHAA